MSRCGRFVRGVGRVSLNLGGAVLQLASSATLARRCLRRSWRRGATCFATSRCLVGAHPKAQRRRRVSDSGLAISAGKKAHFSVSSAIASVSSYRVAGTLGDLRVERAYEYYGALHITLRSRTTPATRSSASATSSRPSSRRSRSLPKPASPCRSRRDSGPCARPSVRSSKNPLSASRSRSTLLRDRQCWATVIIAFRPLIRNVHAGRALDICIKAERARFAGSGTCIAWVPRHGNQ